MFSFFFDRFVTALKLFLISELSLATLSTLLNPRLVLELMGLAIKPLVSLRSSLVSSSLVVAAIFDLPSRIWRYWTSHVIIPQVFKFPSAFITASVDLPDRFDAFNSFDFFFQVSFFQHCETSVLAQLKIYKIISSYYFSV